MSNIIKNSIQKSILFGLPILAIFAFGVFSFMPQLVKAADDTGVYHSYTPGVLLPNNGITTGGYNSNVSSSIAPYIKYISPNSIYSGQNIRTIAIFGRNFTPNSIARLNGADRITNFIDSNRLVMQLNSADNYNYGKFPITVFDTYKVETSNAVTLTVYSTYSAGYTNSNTSSNTSNNNTYTNTTDNSASTNTDTSTDDNYSALASNAIFGAGGFAPSGLVQWVLLAILILVIIILFRKFTGAEDKYHTTPLKHA